MHDIVMRGGIVYDGEGGSPYAADVAIYADLISAVMPAIGDRGCRAGLHQRALVGDPITDRGWRCAERCTPGSDARGLRRGFVDGASHRCHAPRPDRTSR